MVEIFFVEVAHAAGAAQGAIAFAGAADVAAVAIGMIAGFPLALAGTSLGLCVEGGEGLFALLLIVCLDGGQALEEEAQFAGGGDGLPVLVGCGIGLGEAVDLVGEAVGGDGLEDVCAVELEVAEVGVDGRAGTAEPLGDLFGGEALAVEVVGFEDASAASGCGRVGCGHGWLSSVG